MTKFRLLQARLPGDPVRQEERQAFASRLQVSPDDIIVHDMLNETSTFDVVTENVDAILVGGSGAFSILDDAPWIGDFVQTLGQLADSGFPTFASCFGFHGMVLALGGEIRHDEENSEVGSFKLHTTPASQDDPVFGALPSQFVAQEGHKDRATQLPDALVNLASSARCPFQAFRVEGKPVYATQFHPELTGNDNKQRFQRYFDMYSKAFGSSQAQSMLDAFRPSPEANDLLLAFRRHIEKTEGS